MSAFSTDQCIEIAETVWKLERLVVPNRETYWGVPLHSPPMFNNCIVDGMDLFKLCEEVNSWQGFGRTVEAMDKKSWYLNISSMGIFFYTYRNGKAHATMSRDNGLTMESKWEATHLAALEALK